MQDLVHGMGTCCSLVAVSLDEHSHLPADSPESWTLLGSPVHVGSIVVDMHALKLTSK
jgi:hypothetical protein